MLKTSPHAADLGPDTAKLFFESLVATVEVIDAVENSFPIGDQRSQHQRRGRAQVRAHDGSGLQLRLAAHGGGAAVDSDVRSHAVEFADVHEAVLEDVFGDGGGAFSLRREGHELGLHVGGEAGVFLGGDVGGLQRAAVRADADLFGANVELHAALFELGDERAKMRGVAAVDVEVAARDGSGHEEGAGLDAVGVNSVAGSVELRHALHADGGGAGALDLCTHGDEERGEVGDLRLAGAVLKERLALSERCRHQEVFGARDGDLVEDDVRAFQAVGAGFEVAVVVGDGGAHGFKALDVQVGRPPMGASAGHGDTRNSSAGDERAENERAGAHGFDDLVFCDGVGEDGALDRGAMLGATVAELDLGTHADEQLALRLDVANLRNVFEDNFSLGEDGRQPYRGARSFSLRRS